MKIIGLTGGIASGKSIVSSHLSQLGAPIIDADIVAREIVKPGSQALQEISHIFGDSYIDNNGELRRKALGELIFANVLQRKMLDTIMQPLIRQEINKQLEYLKSAGKKVVVLVAPLLFETGLDKIVNEIWVVALRPELQIQRLMQRDNLTKVQAFNRLAAQGSLEEKIPGATKIIDNNGDYEALISQIESLWRIVVDGKESEKTV